jgi:DNA invertase Pin-like site-specific DNA recombinase
MPRTKMKAHAKATYDGPKRVAIYTRVSSAEQALNGTSLAVQEEVLRAFAEAQGWAIVGVWSDKGVSGAKAEADRPQLAALMTVARTGQVDVLLVDKWDRMARNLNAQTTLWGELDTLGVEYVSRSEPASSGPAGEFVRNVMAAVAQDERQRIRARTISGRLARLKDGGWAGGEAPLGFRVQHDSDGRRPRLVIHDAEAKMIRRAVSLLLDEGKTTGEVAAILNSEGYTPRKAPRWHAALLRNHLMKGAWGGTWSYGKENSRRKGRDLQPEPMTVAIPRMLDAERHAHLLRYLRATTLPKIRTHVHPLSGLLVGACGHHYTGVARSDRGRRRYRCAMSKNTGQADAWRCDAPSVLADSIDFRVWNHLVKLLRDPDSLRAAATEHLELLDTSAESIAEALGRAQAKVAECETLLKNAFVKASKGGLPEHLLNEVLAEYRTDLAQAEQRVADLAVMQVDEAANADRMAQVNEVIGLAQDVLVDADPALQATVLRLLDVRVVLQEVSAEGFPNRWVFMGEIAHGSVISLLRGGVPGSVGHLSLAKRTSR